MDKAARAALLTAKGTNKKRAGYALSGGVPPKPPVKNPMLQEAYFAGPKAKTFNQIPEERKFYDPSGMKRFEGSDDKASSPIKSMSDYYALLRQAGPRMDGDRAATLSGTTVPLGQLLNHDDLYRDYPQLRDTPVFVKPPSQNGTVASYSDAESLASDGKDMFNDIINPDFFTGKSNINNEQDMLSVYNNIFDSPTGAFTIDNPEGQHFTPTYLQGTVNNTGNDFSDKFLQMLVHEAQHAVNSIDQTNKLGSTPENYERRPTEMEAFFTADRINMTPEQRAAEAYKMNKLFSNSAAYAYGGTVGKSKGGALDLARAIMAKDRAGGQIAPSKYLPNVPRQVHAGGGKVAYHATHEPFEDYDWGRLGQSTKGNTSETSVDDWASSLASLGPWSHEKPLSKKLGMKTDLPVTLTGKEKKFKSLDHLAQEISRHGGPTALREKLVSQGYGHVSVDDEEFGGKSYVGLSPDHFKITKAGGGKVAFQEGNHPLVPDVLYHGTARDVQSFDPNAKRSYDVDPSNPEETDTGWFGKGHYFTASPKLAAHYADEGAKRQGGQGANIIPAHVSLKNPFVVDMKAYDSGARTLDNALSRAGVPMHPRGWRKPSEQTAALVGMGHDGVIATREGKPEEYVAFHPTQIKSAIGNQGTFDPNDPDITKAEGGRVGYEDGGTIGGTEPKNTVKAYKLFKRKKDGNIYPLFVNANKPVPIGQWLDAEEGPQGKSEGKVKSSLGDLAYRPGWHAGDLPVATHIGGKSRKELTAPDYRPHDHVWAEVEMPNDVDWQSVANSRMRHTADGKPILNTAHITDQLPKGGFYRYKTNPNMTGNWLIGGSMKVNRILHDDEVKQINDAAGTADLPRMPDITKAGGGEVDGDNGHIYVVHGGSDFDQIDPSYSGRGEPGNIRPLGNGLYGYVLDHTNPENVKNAIGWATRYSQKYGGGKKALHVFKVPKSSSTVFNGYRELNVEGYPKPIKGLGLEPTEELNAYEAHKATEPPYDEKNSADFWAHERKRRALWDAVNNAADLRMQHLPIGLTEVAIQNPKVATRIGKFNLDTPTSDILDAVKSDVQGGNITKAGGGSVTDSDEFRNWFGNSVTHTDGDPHVFYHGTSKDKDFTSFNVGRHGAWFTRDPALASQYAEQNDSQGYKQDGWKLTPTNTASRVIPAYVKAENPYTGDLPDEVLRGNYKAAQSDWFDTLRRKGHDAWIPARHNGDLVVALKEPQQIKSIYNNGKFDPNQKHMGKAEGGEVDGEEDGITAYHGSPHSFDSFDIANLGTGEGAQAYGHGLYFAGNEGVAKAYRDQLSGDNIEARNYFKDGKILPNIGEAWQSAHDAAKAAANIPPDHVRAIATQVQNWVSQGKKPETFLRYNQPPRGYEAAYKAAADAWSGVSYKKNKGHMYKVKLNVKPHELLDWDKPLSEQHPNVQAAIKATGVDTGARKWENGADMGNGSRLVVTPHPDLPDEEEFTKYEMQLPSGSRVRLNRNDVARVLGDENLQPNGLTGAQIHQRLVDMGNRHGAIGEHLRAGNPMKRGDKWASEALMEQGLKGIKYRDARSRDLSDGDPTHNYVMFHHDPVQVVDKYEYGGTVGKAGGGEVDNEESGAMDNDQPNNVVNLGFRRTMRNAMSDEPPQHVQDVFNHLGDRFEASRQAYVAAKADGVFDHLPFGDRYKYKLTPNSTPMEVVGHRMMPVERWGMKEPPKLVYQGHYPVVDMEPVGNPADTRHMPVELLADKDRYEFVSGKPRLVKRKGGAVAGALALTRRFTKDGTGATMALKPKGK